MTFLSCFSELNNQFKKCSLLSVVDKQNSFRFKLLASLNVVTLWFSSNDELILVVINQQNGDECALDRRSPSGVQLSVREKRGQRDGMDRGQG